MFFFGVDVLVRVNATTKWYCNNFRNSASLFLTGDVCVCFFFFRRQPANSFQSSSVKPGLLAALRVWLSVRFHPSFFFLHGFCETCALIYRRCGSRACSIAGAEQRLWGRVKPKTPVQYSAKPKYLDWRVLAPTPQHALPSRA